MRIFVAAFVSLLVMASVNATDWHYTGPDRAPKSPVLAGESISEKIEQAETITKDLFAATESMILEVKKLQSDKSKSNSDRKSTLESLWAVARKRNILMQSMRMEFSKVSSKLRENSALSSRLYTLTKHWSLIQLTSDQFTTIIDSKSEALASRSKQQYPPEVIVTPDAVAAVLKAMTNSPTYRHLAKR